MSLVLELAGVIQAEREREMEEARQPSTLGTVAVHEANARWRRRVSLEASRGSRTGGRGPGR